MDNNNNNSNSMMDWEMANADDANEEMDNAAPSCTSSVKIVSNVPVGLEKADIGLGAGNEDMDVDVESFSFGSEEDDKKEDDATGSPELSSPFDIKMLQTVVEASARALDIVTGKDVVMVAGKTGTTQLRSYVVLLPMLSTNIHHPFLFLHNRGGEIDTASRNCWKGDR